MLRQTGMIVAALAALVAFELPAAEADEQSIVIERAWTRAMPSGSDVGAGYVVIRNAGDVPDRLLSATSPQAQRTEIHETTMEDEVMRMRPVSEPLVIEPGETVEMRPGGLHIMFLDVAEPFAEGDEVAANLVFEHDGERTVTLEVEGRPAGAPHGEGDHDHGSHGDH